MVDYENLKLCAARLSRLYDAGQTDDQEAMLTMLAQCTQEEASRALQGGFDQVLNLLSENPSETVVESYVQVNGLQASGFESQYQ